MRFKSFLWLLIILSSFALLGGWYYWEVHGIVKLRVYLEQTLSQKIQGQFKIKTLAAPMAWPFEVQLAGVQLNSKPYGIDGQVDRISLKLNIKSIFFKEKKIYPEIEFKIKKPQIVFHTNDDSSTKKIPQPTSPTQNSQFPIQNLADLAKKIPFIKDFDFSFQISDGQIELNKGSADSLVLSHWDTKIDFDKLTDPIRFNQDFSTTMHFGNLGVIVPAHIEGQSELKNGQVDLLGFRTKFLNIESLISGKLNLNNQSYHIQVRTIAPDLSKIPLDIPEFPIKSWKGSINSDVEIRQDKPDSPLYILGNYQLKSFEAALKYTNHQNETELINLDGIAKISSAGQFQFVKQQSSALYLPSLVWDVDLTNTKIRYKNIFYKHPDIQFTSNGELSWNQKIQIKRSQLKFYSLDVTTSGLIDFNQNSNLILNFSTPSLKGFEAFFPSLSSSPMAGSLQGQLQIDGPLADYKNLKIDIKKIELANGSGKINFKNDTQEYTGPFNIDIRGNALINKMQLERGQITASAQLTSMLIKFKDMFLKPAGDLFTLDLFAQKNNSQLEIKRAHLNTGAGKIQLTGLAPLNPEDNFNLNLTLSNLNLKKVSENIPMLSQYIKDGQYQANLNFKGKLNTSDLFLSPLLVSGSQSVSLPHFNYTSPSQPVEKQATAINTKSKPAAFLKDTPLVSGLNVTTNVNINEFNFNNLKIQGIKISGSLKNKSLAVTGQVQSIFGGLIKINNLQLPLTVDDPNIAYNITAQNIETKSALTWFSDKTKDLMTGLVSLEAQGKTPLPSSADFLNQISSQGKLSIKDAVLNTLPFEKMAKDSLAKIPGVGQIKNSPGPLKTTISTLFSLDKSNLNLKNLVAVTPRNEEMRVDGKVNLNLDVDLYGSIALVDAPVSGSFFEANSDPQRRLIVPMRISGNLIKPELGFADETVRQTTQKMIDYEKNKATKAIEAEAEKAKKQAENQLKSEANKKANELKNQLGKDLEKGVQDLFKR